MLLFHSTKKTSLERWRCLELECVNVAAVPEDLAAVNIKKTRLSQSDYFSLFAVEESVVGDQVQLFLFQPSDLLLDAASPSSRSPKLGGKSITFRQKSFHESGLGSICGIAE